MAKTLNRTLPKHIGPMIVDGCMFLLGLALLPLYMLCGLLDGAFKWWVMMVDFDGDLPEDEQ